MPTMTLPADLANALAPNHAYTYVLSGYELEVQDISVVTRDDVQVQLPECKWTGRAPYGIRGIEKGTLTISAPGETLARLTPTRR